MGAISTKPRLKSVAVNNSAALTAVGSVIALMAASAISRYIASSKSHAKTQTVTSLPKLSSELTVFQNQHAQTLKAQPGITEVEVIKQSALRAFADSSALSSSVAEFAAPVKALMAATSPAAARQAQSQLVEVVKTSHQQAQIANFRVVAAKAFQKIGFASVEEMSGSSNAKLRLVARDAGGRTLVTEFESHAERGESLASEVLGVCHSQSEELLESFEKALEEEGVIGLPPTRKKTGGVAQLEAAREFIHRPVSKMPLQQTAHQQTSKNSAADRSRMQQNNQRNRQRQR